MLCSNKLKFATVANEVVLECLHSHCPSCGSAMWNKYDNYRTVRTLKEVVTLKVRRCPKQVNGSLNLSTRNRAVGHCPNRNLAYYVIALVGALRYGQHRSLASDS